MTDTLRWRLAIGAVLIAGVRCLIVHSSGGVRLKPECEERARSAKSIFAQHSNFRAAAICSLLTIDETSVSGLSAGACMAGVPGRPRCQRSPNCLLIARLSMELRLKCDSR